MASGESKVIEVEPNIESLTNSCHFLVGGLGKCKMINAKIPVISHASTDIHQSNRYPIQIAESKDLAQVKKLAELWWMMDHNLDMELHGVSMLSVVFPSQTTIVIVKKCGRNSDQCPWVAFVLVAHADQCGPMWMISGAFESSKIVAAMAHWQSREYLFGQKSLVKASYEIQKLRDETASLVDNFPKIQVQEEHDLDLRAHRFIMVFSTLAAAAGATPWPFLEFFLLLGILRTMSMDLARTYQLVLRPSFQWQLLASFPKISAIFVTAIMLGSLLKITPNLRAVGGLINAIMISWYNTAMGSLLQEIFRRHRFRHPMGEVAFSDVCQVMTLQEQQDFFLQQFGLE